SPPGNRPRGRSRRLARRSCGTARLPRFPSSTRLPEVIRPFGLAHHQAAATAPSHLARPSPAKEGDARLIRFLHRRTADRGGGRAPHLPHRLHLEWEPRLPAIDEDRAGLLV